MEDKNVNKKLGFFKALGAFPVMAKTMIVLLALACAALIAVGISERMSSKEKIVEIGFEDIGELSTQVAYCTEIGVLQNDRKLFGVDIPFTQSKYIYSYDFVVKAGYDFAEIKAKVDNENNVIDVFMPDAQITGSDIDPDSFIVYHEDESIYNRITLEENNDEVKKMKNNAIEKAKEKGILDNAEKNAKKLLEGFICNMFDKNVYKIEFHAA